MSNLGSNHVQCYRCGHIVEPVTTKVYENSGGYVGIDVPGSNATVYQPVPKSKYVGLCPYCGAEHWTADAEQRNREKSEFEGIVMIVCLSFIGFLVLVFIIAVLCGAWAEQ